MSQEADQILKSLSDQIPFAERAFSKEQMALDMRISASQSWMLACTPTNIKAVLEYVHELEKQARCWIDPTREMVEVAIAEFRKFDGDPDDEDDHISDLVVFMLQAMASKLPKV